MTVSFIFGGLDLTDRVRVEDGITLTTAADGSFATGTLQVDDPDGSLTLENLAYFTAEEDACDPPRIFTGYAYDLHIPRGGYKAGVSRVWTIDFADLNFLLNLRAFHAADAKRAEETVTSRMDWLMASVGMDGLVYDNGMIAAVSDTFLAGERDYRQDGYASDVLSDCVVVERVFFVYWDPVAEQPSLFFASPNATLNESTLRISNVKSDIDDSTTFWGYMSGELDSEGSGIYDGVVYVYPGGIIYRQRSSTFATYGIHRDGRVNTDRARTAARAEQQAQEFLDKHSGAVDTISVTIRLPRDKVNLIDAGMRVQIKFSHIPGYESFTWSRVTRRTVLFTKTTNLFYDLQLELSTAGLSLGTGGSPGDLPHPPPSGPPAYVQEKGFSGYSIVLDNPVTAGHLLTWEVASRIADVTVGPPTGWTMLASCTNDTDGFIRRYGAVYYKIADGSEGVNIDALAGTSGLSMHVFEWADGVDIDTAAGTFGSISDQSGAGTLAVSVTPSAVSTVVGFGLLASSDVAPLFYTPGSGVTVLFQETVPGGFPPRNFVGIKTNQSGPSVVDVAITGSSGWGGVTYAVHGTGSGQPPGTATHVGPETVVMTGDSGTTAYPFADGSLQVFVDNVDETAAIIAQNPVAGTFQLGFAPTSTEVVVVYYQGR